MGYLLLLKLLAEFMPQAFHAHGSNQGGLGTRLRRRLSHCSEHGSDYNSTNYNIILLFYAKPLSCELGKRRLFNNNQGYKKGPASWIGCGAFG